MGKRIKGRPKKRQDVAVSELRGIVERTGTQPITAEEQAKLRSAIETLAFLTAEIEAKGASIEQLRYFLFGARSERASKVFDKAPAGADADAGGGTNAGAGGTDTSGGDAGKRKGHGKNGASAYPGATKVRVPHPGLCGGDGCPGCINGKVYALEEPSTLVRVRGVAPLQATLYARDRLRCNLCGEVFTAPAPDGVGETKYDETATSMIALLKYGTGLAFNRIETLQAGMGIPLPAATQWDLVHAAAKKVAPAFDELIRQAAQGKVLHNDDTSMQQARERERAEQRRKIELVMVNDLEERVRRHDIARQLRVFLRDRGATFQTREAPWPAWVAWATRYLEALDDSAGEAPLPAVASAFLASLDGAEVVARR